MALNREFAIFMVIATIFLKMTSAKEFIVGDEVGWTINYDYQTWTKDKEFLVGDIIVFQYPVGVHNVFKVNGTAFQNCTVPPLNEAMSSGNDTIVLSSPGRKWYICGKSMHCQNGQKLFITVLPQTQPPSIAPTASPSQTQRPSIAPAASPTFNAMPYSSRLSKRLFINFPW